MGDEPGGGRYSVQVRSLAGNAQQYVNMYSTVLKICSMALRRSTVIADNYSVYSPSSLIVVDAMES